MGDQTKLCYIVDDDELVGRAMKRTLQALYGVRMRFEWFTWGSDALEACRTQLPDILITDIQSPRMQGDEVAREMRLLKPDLPVIMTSADGEALEEAAAGVAGARTVAKPSPGAAYKKHIDELLGLDQPLP